MIVYVCVWKGNKPYGYTACYKTCLSRGEGVQENKKYGDLCCIQCHIRFFIADAKYCRQEGLDYKRYFNYS